MVYYSTSQQDHVGNNCIAVVVNTTLAWLRTASLQVDTASSTEESFNGSYVLQWARDNLLSVDLFSEDKPGATVLGLKNITRMINVNWPERTAYSTFERISVSCVPG